jgi:hypothetical protein
VSRTRRIGYALGVVLVAVGLVAVFVPGFARGFGTSPKLLTVVGGIALLGAVAAVSARLRTDDAEGERPTPERKQSHPTPGDEFDEQLASLTPRGRRQGAGERRAVRDRLDTVAVSVLVRDGVSEAVARERLAEGTWTDDPYAAAFFAEERATDAPLEERLRAAFSSEPNMRKRARHAVSALTRIADRERKR